MLSFSAQFKDKKVFRALLWILLYLANNYGVMVNGSYGEWGKIPEIYAKLDYFLIAFYNWYYFQC